MSQSPIMSPHDVSTLLQIKESTLRKYSLLLENVGYKFQRNNQNQRWYNDTDIVALKKLISLKNSTDMNLKECSEAVLLWANSQTVTQSLTISGNDTERHDDGIKELKELVTNQNEMIKELLSRMDHQQKYIDERLEQRDKMFMESIRESQEERKALLQIAVAHEEEKKKGFFTRLFGK